MKYLRNFQSCSKVAIQLTQQVHKQGIINNILIILHIYSYIYYTHIFIMQSSLPLSR